MIKNILKIVGKANCIKKYYSGMATIFMLHRVSEFDKLKLGPNENMKITPEFLEKFITQLKGDGYEFISLDELYIILKSGKSVNKKIAFTLDDGYKDNYTSAYPIFKKHNVPFTIYVTASFPENKSILWWYLIEDLILKEDYIVLNNGQNFECDSKEKKEITFLQIRDIILKLEKHNFNDSLSKLFSKYEIDWFSLNKQLCMNWDEIIEMSKAEICTIASHTKNHLPLNTLSTNKVKNEVLEGNRIIEEKIEKSIQHFAYPFGSKNEVGQREFEIIKNLGFKTATTSRRGNIYKKHKNYLEILPRIMLTENFNINEISRLRREIFVTK